jgi:hypothetical protein
VFPIVSSIFFATIIINKNKKRIAVCFIPATLLQSIINFKNKKTTGTLNSSNNNAQMYKCDEVVELLFLYLIAAIPFSFKS